MTARALTFALALLATPALAADWRPLDLENTLVIETTKGRVVIELRPELAPQGVARVKRLARDGVYHGLQFHRVIDGFVAQTGNPNNRDGGTSALPDLPPEFTARLAPGLAAIINERSDSRDGFLGAAPLQAVSSGESALSPDPRLRVWGAYCPGVVGLGRQADPGSANSEFFIMRGPARRLDHEYTVIGRVVSGQAAVAALAVGEPPKVPDLMLRVAIAADLPPGERPRLEVATPGGAPFRETIDRAKARGAAFSVCDVEIPVRSP
jgi:peptidylprolyl isomerase